MALRDLSGVGALQDALTQTNSHLIAVLEELRTTNNHRLEEVAAELRTLNGRLDQFLNRVSEDAARRD